MQEDFMNNCAIRTGLSGVMGLGLGAMFGVAMGTFDTAVSCSTLNCTKIYQDKQESSECFCRRLRLSEEVSVGVRPQMRIVKSPAANLNIRVCTFRVLAWMAMWRLQSRRLVKH